MIKIGFETIKVVKVTVKVKKESLLQSISKTTLAKWSFGSKETGRLEFKRHFRF